MQIKTERFEDLIIAILAITGEIKESCLYDICNDTGYTTNNTKRYVNELVRKKLIRKFKTEKNENLIRIKYPEGEEAILNISKDLYFNYRKMVMALDVEEKSGHIKHRRYIGGVLTEHRRQDKSELISKFIQAGMEVNDFRLNAKKHEVEQGEKNSRPPAVIKDTHITVFEKDGMLKDPKFFLQTVTSGRTVHFTNNVIPMEILSQSNTKAYKENLSRTHGVIVTDKTAYMVYYLKGENYKWNVNPENLQERFYARQIFPMAVVEKDLARLRLGTLLFIDNTDAFVTWMPKTDVLNGKKSNPLQFKQPYVIPMDQDISILLNMIVTPGCINRVIENLFFDSKNNVSKATPEEEYDARIGNCLIYELFSCNVRKWFNARNYWQESKNMCCVISSWQKDAVKAYLEMTDEEFENTCIIAEEQWGRFWPRVEEIVEESRKEQIKADETDRI